MSLLLLFVLGVVSVYFIFFYESRKARLLRSIPSPGCWPIVGHALSMNVSSELLFRYLEGAVMLNKGMTVGWLFNLPYVTAARPDVVQKVLSSNTHIDKSADYDMVMPWLGTGLLTSKGEKWARRRKMLTPTFHFRILDDFIGVMNEQATTLVQIFREEFGQGEAFNVFPYVTRCALDIICETAMGKKVHAQQNKDSEYVKAVYRINQLIQHRQKQPWLYPDFMWQMSAAGQEEKKLLAVLHGFTETVIRERKLELSTKRRGSLKSSDNLVTATAQTGGTDDEGVFTKGGKRLEAFLDLLLILQAESAESGENQLTDLDIREETDTFMFEGHDTTASSMNWTIFLLGSNPECQAKVHEELDTIFGTDRTRPVTQQDLGQMKYLECCIKESLRLYPSVPFIARAIKTDLQINDELTIPAGATAFIMPYNLHRDPHVFPEPQVFFPDRFFPENSIGRNPFAYVPFSGGPRNCIGQKFAMMEEKVVLANVFRNFKVTAAERREDLVLLAEIIIRPKNGLHIKLSSRP